MYETMTVDSHGRAIGSVPPIQVGETLRSSTLGPLTVMSVTQRNWSRVARVECDGTTYFAKQFVDRVQRPHQRGFLGDQEVMESLATELCPGISVIPVLERIEDRLVYLSPHIEMATIDSVGSEIRRQVDRAAAVGGALRAILEERAVGDSPNSVSVWKGLDPKNIGWTDAGKLWVFDFGPRAVLPQSTAAARVIAAGLLCRWSATPGTHLVWPERDVLRAVCAPIVELTEFGAVETELARHTTLRLREPQRTGVAAAATRVGLLTLGRLHWASLTRIARQLFADQ